MVDDQEKLIRSVIEIVKTVTRCADVNSASSTENLQQWDSLAYMTILSEIELSYGVEITEDNIEQFNSIKSIVGLILNKAE